MCLRVALRPIFAEAAEAAEAQERRQELQFLADAALLSSALLRSTMLHVLRWRPWTESSADS